ncbi:MAG: Smr/MutS family protein [Bacteroidaceae bacterium]|nr:Smr/MutS family protein [Bacteroidaceae bacterium]
MLYPQNYEQKVGFNEIRSLLLGHCLSPLGRDRVGQISFLTDAAQVRLLQSQVHELRTILSELRDKPQQDFFDLRPAIQRIRIEGTHLEEQEIWDLYRSLCTLHAWVEIIRSEEDDKPRWPALQKMLEGVFTFYAVTKRIDQLLDKYGRIKDSASPALADIRSELRRSEGSVSHTLNRILRAAQAEGLVDKDVAPTLRDGRLVIPVAPAMKRRISGIIHDESATGKTVFIEPTEVVEANNRIRELEAEEKREVIRILKEFTETLRGNLKELARSFEGLADIELVRAKACLADQMQAVMPEIGNAPLIDWTMARHPLLEASLRKQGRRIVPLEIALSRRQRILVISGPNAGGKSVCLKTVGLLQYMLQCGLPVPMGENARTGSFRHLFIDIGDEQSIEDDLSTYSSHLLNMKQMMRSCDPSSLILIDEFGGGTEPTIGGAIAQAILKRYVERGTFGIITTHYQNLKHMAEDTPGLVNGAMLYDRRRMEALFQLQIGNPGSSFAVEIARKTGIPEDVIADATELVGQEYVNADKYLLDITRDKRYWEGKRQTIHERERQMEQTIQRYEQEIAELQGRRKDIIRQAREQAEEIVQRSNAMVERTIREIREAQAEKERTRQVRQELEDFRQQLEEEERRGQDEDIERKMKQIEERRRRKEERKKKQAAEGGQQTAGKQPETNAPKPLQAGDSVRLKGQTAQGRIEEINGRRATVTFGMMRTIADLGRLERCTPATSGKEGDTLRLKDKVQQTSLKDSLKDGSGYMRERHLNFRQDIDVRGMRGDEALQAVTYFIDDALLVGAAKVRILHGTGSGILRELIRQYLRTVPAVRSAHDEHVQFGGAGITVVELA